MILDILLVLFAAAGFWLGYTKGLVRTLLSVACYILALILTLAISPYVMDLIIRWFHASKVFALIFGTLFVMILLIFLINWILKSTERYLRKTRLGAFSKTFGGIIMMFVAMVACSYFIYALIQLDWIGSKTKEKNYTYPIVEQVPVKTRAVITTFKPVFRRYWDLMEQTIEEEKAK